VSGGNYEIRERVTLDQGRRYEVWFAPGGKVEVFALFDRKPVNRRGFYQADNGARRLNPAGPTARRAIAAASAQIDTRVAIEMLESGAREY
jgi:hypothetical protein